MGVTRQMSGRVVIVMPLAFSPRHNDSYNRLNVYCIFMHDECFMFLMLYSDWFMSRLYENNVQTTLHELRKNRPVFQI